MASDKTSEYRVRRLVKVSRGECIVATGRNIGRYARVDAGLAGQGGV